MSLLPLPLRRFLHKSFPQFTELRLKVDAINQAFEAMATPLSEDFGNSLNGQMVRRRLVEEVFKLSRIESIVETGTFKGDTTHFFSKFGVEVISSEISPALYYAAQSRLAAFSNISLFYGDSRQLLERLRGQSSSCQKFTFFYLDAHWYDDLPLKKEIEIIASSWRNFIILIDDFKVGHDANYGYDDYGKGKRLDVSYLAEFFEPRRLDGYFPAVSSREETGARRGYIFLTPHGMNKSVFSNATSFSPVQV